VLEHETCPFLIEWGLMLVSTARGMVSFPVESFVIDDVVEVNRITTILPRSAVLSYPPMSITLSQSSITAGQRCFFTSDMLHPIIESIPNGWLTSMVPCQRFCYNDLAHHFSPYWAIATRGES
jgi:hypothetical protein